MAVVDQSMHINYCDVTIYLRMLTKNRMRENNYFICKLKLW